MGEGDTLIFCDNCSCLALAELDHAFLCTECLLDLVADSGRSVVTMDIRPLEVNARLAVGPVRAREAFGVKVANF